MRRQLAEMIHADLSKRIQIDSAYHEYSRAMGHETIEAPLVDVEIDVWAGASFRLIITLGTGQKVAYWVTVEGPDPIGPFRLDTATEEKS